MAHEILSIKLCQLDESVGRLHGRIYRSETADHSELLQEICRLRQECADAESALRENLRRSKSGLVAVLAQGYEQMEQVIQKSNAQLQAMAADNPDAEATVEEKILLAEYALDFAHQAAGRALLLAMEAIDAQMLQQQEGKTL